MKRILVLAIGWLCCAAFAATDGEQHEHRGAAAPPSDPRFEFLKQLAGGWSAQPGEAGAPGGALEFSLTAGGHAVLEREFSGTPMEMTTLYYMQGDELVATHYCMLGNRPRMIAAKTLVDNTLSFACDGKPGNTASHRDQHVHGWTIKLDRGGLLHYSAELVAEGQVTEAPALVLARQ